MRIGIEAQRLFRKKKHGMDMVALELIRNLQQIDRYNEYFIFVKPDEDASVLQETPNVKIIELAGGPYPVWEQFALPKAVKQYGCQLLHCTSNTAPVYCPVPLVTTLHDIIYMESSFTGILTGTATPYQKFGNIYRKLIVPKVVRNSQRIITVSNFEKKRIADFFQLGNDDRLQAVYNGVSDHFKRVTDHAALQSVKAKYRLPDHFLFFLGNTDPKKNTRGTLKAFSQFLQQTNTDYKLVMLDYDQAELKNLLADIGDPALIDKIVLTGYVVNTDLPAIYSQSAFFLYPSLRESFGIPMLEAMACGSPVITSNTSSMPEVAGGAAVLVDPFNVDEIVSAMIQLHSDAALRSQLVTAGYQQSSRFSWQAMAKDVLKIYHEVAAPGVSNYTTCIGNTPAWTAINNYD